MAKVVRNMAELEKAMGKLLEEHLKRAAIEVEEIIKDFVKTEFYDQYEPKSYERQEWILKKCTSTDVIQQGNTYSVVVYIDPKGVSYADDPALDVWGGMAEGWHGNVVQTEGRFWDATLESIDRGGVNDLLKMFKEFLIMKGFNVVVK